MHPGHLLDRVVFARPYRSAARAFAAFAALLLPSSCVLCGRWDTSLCPPCLAVFRRATSRPFRAEGGAASLPDVPLVLTADLGRHGPPPDGRAPTRRGPATPGEDVGPLPVVAAGRYGRAVSGILLSFKNHGHVDIAPPIAAALAGALHEAMNQFPRPGGAPGEAVLLVPVPSRSSSTRRRGYDPLMLLLTRLHRTGRLPAGSTVAAVVRQVPAVTRLRGTVVRRGRGPAARLALAGARAGRRGGQKGLGRRRRRSNVMSTMTVARSARRQLGGRSCIIVDDVLTTGATINEVHRALRAGGLQVLGAVVVAATASPAGDGADRTPTRSTCAGDPPSAPGPGAYGRPANYRKFWSVEG